MTPSTQTRRGFTQLPSKVRRGFTLIELIIVIAIIAVIAAGTFVALDPARRLHAGRNSHRWTDVTAILQAIKSYQADSPTSALPFTIDALATRQIIGTAATGCDAPLCLGAAAEAACVNAVNLTSYLPSIPYDPSISDGTGLAESRYYINSTNGIITVGACDAEGEGAGGGGTAPAISVSN